MARRAPHGLGGACVEAAALHVLGRKYEDCGMRPGPRGATLFMTVENRRRKGMNVLKRAVRRWAELGTREIIHEEGTRERRPVIIRSSRV